uniref:type II toxin-antitoxin system antitoxin SocA domain-containing protein n=1 Tax=Ezakiella massiliensis TaxID=1852374 RepID=UPI00094F38B5|nr:type II toxin-antitoxin system antitoxin SocA domain-containing protein [Ezakiella massiliensis]
MAKNKFFCDGCRDFVDYKIINEDMNQNLKGKDYFFSGKRAFCQSCGNELYPDEVSEYNLKTLYDVYRKENSIISHEDIKNLPEMYDIGKRPLSTLLDLGEQTLTRYIDGDLPTKQYSDYLQRVHDEPVYYNEILEKNKDKISDVTYRKSKAAVEEILNSKSIEKTKIKLACDYLINAIGDITPLALQKCLYYFQGFFMAFNGRPVFNEDCEAWVHGPVYRETYNEYKDYSFNPIEARGNFDQSGFTQQEFDILDSVINYASCYSGKVLEEITHMEEPWRKARKDLPAFAPSNEIIVKEDICDYFTKVKDRYGMINPSDMGDYFKDMFIKQSIKNNSLPMGLNLNAIDKVSDNIMDNYDSAFKELVK